MEKKTNPKSIKRHYQKKIAKMSYSFLVQALDKTPDEVRRIYQSFCDEWTNTVEKVNKKHGYFALAYESWRNVYERDGYKNIIFMPIPPAEKSSLLRIVYIVEGKTEKQRERREFKYKFYFILFRLKAWFKSKWT